MCYNKQKRPKTVPKKKKHLSYIPSDQTLFALRKAMNTSRFTTSCKKLPMLSSSSPRQSCALGLHKQGDACGRRTVLHLLDLALVSRVTITYTPLYSSFVGSELKTHLKSVNLLSRPWPIIIIFQWCLRDERLGMDRSPSITQEREMQTT